MTSVFASSDAHTSCSSIAPTNSCDGTYEETCDPLRDYDISQVRNFFDIVTKGASR